ncbi:hypothetical protein MMC10_006692 [Thelotrema lepadinum]|nr:hypothetical protein [Thelotrema lepadinum]
MADTPFSEPVLASSQPLTGAAITASCFPTLVIPEGSRAPYDRETGVKLGCVRCNRHRFPCDLEIPCSHCVKAVAAGDLEGAKCHYTYKSPDGCSPKKAKQSPRKTFDWSRCTRCSQINSKGCDGQVPCNKCLAKGEEAAKTCFIPRRPQTRTQTTSPPGVGSFAATDAIVTARSNSHLSPSQPAATTTDCYEHIEDWLRAEFNGTNEDPSVSHAPTPASSPTSTLRFAAANNTGVNAEPATPNVQPTTPQSAAAEEEGSQLDQDTINHENGWHDPIYGPLQRPGSGPYFYQGSGGIYGR